MYSAPMRKRKEEESGRVRRGGGGVGSKLGAHRQHKKHLEDEVLRSKPEKCERGDTCDSSFVDTLVKHLMPERHVSLPGMLVVELLSRLHR